ncbi:hypothetical protein [Bradyrhizobium sp. CB1015]|uniref:hypothetical protein n=1 Tax=Bradyrhizobium sp. CB1015 TaxID=2976822 RepID=UPI0021AA0F91|nr:hypothetical protein [Bradyrhizobium sp. CB1015]UWU89434.1 hypothetical protein N2604_23350 [Bradyrhizobium sp. CB1015]
MRTVSRWMLASTVAVIILASGGLYTFSLHGDLASCLRTQAETVVAEQHKQELSKSIGSLEQDVRSLGWMKLQLKGEIGDSELRRDRVRDEIAALEEKRRQGRETLDATEFELVREVIGVAAATSLSIRDMPLNLSYETRRKGFRPQTKTLWPAFIEQIRRTAGGFMTPKQQELAAEVVRKFEQQCSHLRETQIDVPALIYPDKDDPDFERKRSDLLEKERILSDALSLAILGLQDCLHNVRQQS